MRKTKSIVVILALCMGSMFSITALSGSEKENEKAEIMEMPSVTCISSTLVSASEEKPVAVILKESEEEQELLSDEDIALIALVTMAEAEGE